MGHFGGKNCGHELIPLADYAEKDAAETLKTFEEYRDLIIAGTGIPKDFMEPPSPEPVPVGDYTTSPPTEIPSFEKWALPIIRNIYPKMVAKDIIGVRPKVYGTYPEDYKSTPDFPEPPEINIKLTGTTIKARSRKLKAKWTYIDFGPPSRATFPREYPADYSTPPIPPITGHMMNREMFGRSLYIYAPFVPVWKTPVVQRYQHSLRKDYFSSIVIT